MEYILCLIETYVKGAVRHMAEENMLVDELDGEEEGCGCGEHDLPEPTIDATAIPHRLRHAAVLGAAQSMNAGESFIIRAPHLPRPLLAQIAQLPGEWTFEVIVDGPEFWDVRTTRLAL